MGSGVATLLLCLIGILARGERELSDGSWMERKAWFVSQNGESYGYPNAALGGAQRALQAPNGTAFEAFVSRELGRRLGRDVYLDWAASALYTDTQVDESASELKSTLFGNPHSLSASATRSSDAVEAARQQVLDYLGASSDKYEVIFTRSCTDSLRLVADTFPWDQGGEFKYLVQNHNSVLGIRDVARAHGATASVIEPEAVDTWLDSIDQSPGPASLFAFPGEENFAGETFPLEWARLIVDGGSRWRVLVDAAKMAATHPINLTQYPVDFLTMSFYKLFGAPTGVGALVVRLSTADELNKCYWGGGSVSLAGAGRSPDDDVHILKSRVCERFEDGTVSFLGIASLKHGFAALDRVGGPAAIYKHTSALTDYLDGRLRALTHANGNPLVLVYGPNDRHHKAPQSKGSVVNFNVLQSDGTTQYSHIDVMAAAAEAGIHIRAGAQCNPGAAQDILGVPPSAIRRLALDTSLQGCGLGPAFVTCPKDELISQPSEVAYGSDDGVSAICDFAPVSTTVQLPLGSVRASLGYLSTFDDVETLARFLEQTFRA